MSAKAKGDYFERAIKKILTIFYYKKIDDSDIRFSQVVSR